MEKSQVAGEKDLVLWQIGRDVSPSVSGPGEVEFDDVVANVVGEVVFERDARRRELAHFGSIGQAFLFGP